jgi:hypothetical protein
VPAESCKGIVDEPDGSQNCYDPCYKVEMPKDCDATGLQAALDALTKSIAAQVSQKTALDEAIREAGVQQAELQRLVTGFTETLDKYDRARPALLSREDVLRGFFEKAKATIESNLDANLRDALTNAINCEYCKKRMTECCKQTLHESLNCTVPLIKERDDAISAATQAAEAFAKIKDLAGAVIGARFTELERVQQQITEAWQNKKYRLMFYLFYWQFVPKFCAKFVPEICCDQNGPVPEQQQQSTPAGNESNKPACIGSAPGDWHPSKIDREKLQKLLCCAFGLFNEKKAKAQELTAAVKKKEDQLRFVTEKLTKDGEKLDQTIRDKLDSIKEGYECVPKMVETPTAQ